VHEAVPFRDLRINKHRNIFTSGFLLQLQGQRTANETEVNRKNFEVYSHCLVNGEIIPVFVCRK
jgi:hypothetical protein